MPGYDDCGLIKSIVWTEALARLMKERESHETFNENGFHRISRTIGRHLILSVSGKRERASRGGVHVNPNKLKIIGVNLTRISRLFVANRIKQSGWKRVEKGLKYRVSERNFKRERERDISVADDYICYV